MSQKYVIQLISSENGKRSPEMMLTHDEFRHALQIMCANETTKKEDYVLVAAVLDTTDEQLTFLTTPIITVGQLLDNLKEKIHA